MSFPDSQVGGVFFLSVFREDFSVSYDVLQLCGAVGVWELLRQECLDWPWALCLNKCRMWPKMAWCSFLLQIWGIFFLNVPYVFQNKSGIRFETSCPLYHAMQRLIYYYANNNLKSRCQLVFVVFSVLFFILNVSLLMPAAGKWGHESSESAPTQQWAMRPQHWAKRHR